MEVSILEVARGPLLYIQEKSFSAMSCCFFYSKGLEKMGYKSVHVRKFKQIGRK